MAQLKISEYPAKTTFNDGDLYDVSTYDGISAYTSEKLTFAQLKAELNSALNFVSSNLYTADGTLSGNRTVTMGGNYVDFNGGNFGIGIGAAPSQPLHVNGNAQVDGQINSASNLSVNKLLLSGSTTATEMARIGNGNVGSGSGTVSSLFIDANCLAGTNTHRGIYSQTWSTNGANNYGIYGTARNGSSTAIGVFGNIAGGGINTPSTYAVYGQNSHNGVGGSHYGALFFLNIGSTAATGINYGVRGQANVTGGTGTFYGGHFEAKSTGTGSQNVGLYATATSGTTNYAIKSDGNINMANLPTSFSGLSSGDLWNDAGTLKIV